MEETVGLRHFLLIGVMLGDVLVILACAWVLAATNFHSLFAWILVFISFLAWRESGSFNMWCPSVIRRFMKNAKEMGL